jgi:hypothetical protein
MPPRSLPSPALRSLSTAEASKSFVCPSCSFKNTIARGRFFRPRSPNRRGFSSTESPTLPYPSQKTSRLYYRSPKPSAPQRRSVFTIAATTSVNSPSLVSAQNRPLYDALSELGHKATAYVSLARVKSVLSSLEAGEKPAIRIAVLGLNGHAKARKLVQLLLADALGEQNSWEGLITDNDERGLLVR